MLYRVLIDGIDMLDYNNPGLVLLSPQVEVELDTSGSFEFTVPPTHLYYDRFTPESIMKMTVEVWEDSILHWFGRPIEYHLDFYKNKKINCEGGLAYFNDSVIRSEEWDQTSLSTIFAAVIAEHNSMVPSNRQFSVGNFTVSDRPVYRKFNYEQTFDALKSKFLDAEEGHFFVRRENGVNYIDFLKDMPYTCNQDVEFAENLLNFTYNFDGKDFATCVIPLGGTDQETGKPIDIKSVNGGSDILIGNAAANYGNIVKVQQYSDIEDPSELVAEGRKYLTTLQYNAFLIECSAVDLHSKDGSQQQFRVGQMVTCISNPHGIRLELPISKMVLYLDSAAKQITLGRIPKKTLSRFYKEKIAADDSGDGWGGGIEEADEVPEGWTIVPPDIDGGEPTLKKIPIAIQVTHQPLQINYTQETKIFDITGLEVKAVATARPLTYFSDERYPTGVIPHNELHFNASNGSQYYVLEPGQTNVLLFHKAKILVGIYWYCPYDNKKHIASFYIYDKVQEALDAAMAPHHIKIEIPPTKLDYYDGEHINLSGAKVVAYKEDDTPYTADGYQDGVIPNSELVLDPSVADKDQVTETEYTSDLDIDSINQPIPASGASAINFLVGYNESEIRYVFSSDENVNAVGFGTLNGIKRSIVFATSTKNTVIHRQMVYKSGDIQVLEDRYTSESFTYKGKTVYYHYYEHDGWYSRELVGPWIDETHSLSENIAAKVAWTIVYGEAEEAKQEITVQWAAPGDVTLEDTFKIEVKEGGILSGR